MSEEEKSTLIKKLTSNVAEEDYTVSCLAIGMTFGMAIGIILQIMTSSMSYFVMSLAIGMLVGFGIGLVRENERILTKVADLQKLCKAQKEELNNK